VIVEVVPEKIAALRATMARVGEKGAEEISHYSEADLSVINDFLTRMEAITHDEATALRDTPDPTAGSSEHAAPVGGLERARLLFRSGANEFLIRGGTDPDDLYRAKFEGPVPQVRLRDGIVSVQYKGRLQWDWRGRRADIALNTGVAWDIEVAGGANKLQGKLSLLDLRSFEHTGGVEQIRLTLGNPNGSVPISFTGGANNIRIERPTGSAVRLHLVGGATGIDFDRQKLNAAGGDTVLESAGASTARDLYQVEIIGGVNRVTIVEVD